MDNLCSEAHQAPLESPDLRTLTRLAWMSAAVALALNLTVWLYEVLR